MQGFTLWIEHEQYDEPVEDDDFFNIEIRLSDGRRYAANVWKIDAVARIVADPDEAWDTGGGRYTLGPDLLVAAVDRAFLEGVVADLIARDALPEWWLCDDEDDDDDEEWPTSV